MRVKVIMFRFLGHIELLNRYTKPKLTKQLTVNNVGPMKLVEISQEVGARSIMPCR